MVYGSKDIEPGCFTLNLNKKTIASELNTPAIIWKGGVLKILNGTIKTAYDVIHVGAKTVTNNDALCVDILGATITSTNARCVYVHSNDEATTHKTVEVSVMKGAKLTGNASTGAIALDSDQYTIDKNVHVQIIDSTVTPEFTVKQ